MISIKAAQAASPFPRMVTRGIKVHKEFSETWILRRGILIQSAVVSSENRLLAVRQLAAFESNGLKRLLTKSRLQDTHKHKEKKKKEKKFR